ncbi:MAG: hypothetical protein JWP78_2258 [Mucilaginibacter sp.]|nr:hypothetical protein [Mucilaginibacter sp.]
MKDGICKSKITIVDLIYDSCCKFKVDHYPDLIAENPVQFAIKVPGQYRFAVLKIFPCFMVSRIEE